MDPRKDSKIIEKLLLGIVRFRFQNWPRAFAKSASNGRCLFVCLVVCLFECLFVCLFVFLSLLVRVCGSPPPSLWMLCVCCLLLLARKQETFA